MDISEISLSLGAITTDEVDAFGVDWALTGFTGWGAVGSTINVSQRTRQAGGYAGQAYAKSRSMGASGEFYAPTPAAARLALDRLNAACSLDDTVLVVHEAGQDRSLIVRRSDQVMPAWVTPTYCTWSVQVIALDHRKLHAALSGSTSLPSTTGGLTVPFTVPVTIGAVQATGQITLTNHGNTAGPVFGRIDGPCVGPIVTHSGPGGGQLVFASSLVLAEGEWLDIDYERHEVLANGQASRNGYILARGWSTFEPGVNTWSFTAASFNAASQLTITATPADD